MRSSAIVMNAFRPEPPTASASDLWRKAARYAVAQPFIIDKTPFYEKMARLIAQAKMTPQVVAELGVGTGGFLEYAAQSGVWPQARLLGCDLSWEMLELARAQLAAAGERARLIGGVNALDPAGAFYRDELRAGSADVVALSQFEHHAPNAVDSPMAARLARSGLAFVDKAALRRLAFSRLRPGGWLFVIDDYAAATEEQNRQWQQAWDAHVVAMFARPEVIARLAETDAAWAAQIAQSYSPDRPHGERLVFAARARQQRRLRRCEEIQPLAEARADFAQLFAGGECGCIPHPLAGAHPQFYLFWGRKKTDESFYRE